MKYLYANIIPVRGYFRSLLYDLQRGTYIFIPTIIFKDFIKSKYLYKVNVSHPKIITELKEKEYIFDMDPKYERNFPSLNRTWDYPGIIQVILVDLNALTHKLLHFISEINIKTIGIIITDENINLIHLITNFLSLNFLSRSFIESIELIFKTRVPKKFSKKIQNFVRLACVKSEGKWGFINIKGEFVIQPNYDNPGVFYDGLSKVGNMVGNGNGSTKYFYIDKIGKNVFGREFKFGEDFNNGVAMVKDDNYKQLFLNLKGETITDGPPLLYNHWKYPKKPYGGQIKNIVEWDPKKGMPKEVKHDQDNYGYTDEFGNAATEAIYCDAGEFYYSYATPARFFFTNKIDTANVNALENTSKQNYTITEVQASYKGAESFESEDGERTILTFLTSDKKEIIFDAYNSENKLIPGRLLIENVKGGFFKSPFFHFKQFIPVVVSFHLFSTIY